MADEKTIHADELESMELTEAELEEAAGGAFVRDTRVTWRITCPDCRHVKYIKLPKGSNPTYAIRCDNCGSLRATKYRMSGTF